MAAIESTYRIAQYKGGLPHYGEVGLRMEVIETHKLEIVEKYQGEGWVRQGDKEFIPSEGYEPWKQGIQNGIRYAYTKLKHTRGMKVTVVQANGLITDTNPTILAFAASRAILTELENSETEEERKELEQLMFSSWDYPPESIPNLAECVIRGEKRPVSKYADTSGNSAQATSSKGNNLLSKLKSWWS